MIGALIFRVTAMTISLSYIYFTANDWLYACFFGCHVEVDDAVHCAVVSNGKAVHAQFFGSGNKLRNTAHAIKQAILGMDMEVGELLWHCSNYSMAFWHCAFRYPESLRSET